MSYWVESRPEFYVQTGGMHENPYGVPRDELLRMVEEMPPEVAAQVVFGKYVDLSGLVFTAELINQMFDGMPRVKGERYVDEAAAQQAQIAKRIGRHDPYRYATGIDLARKKDYTVITVLDVSTLPARVVYWRRTNRVPWDTIYAEIGRSQHLFRGEFLIDETGVGDVVKEALESRMYCPTHHLAFEAAAACPRSTQSPCVEKEIFRFDPTGYIMSAGSKVQLINNLQRCLGEGYDSNDPTAPFGLIRSPRLPALEEEFPAYAWDDKKLDTDSVMSMALAAWQGLEQRVEAAEVGSPYGGRQ